MTLCRLSMKGLSRGAWAALLAWSAVAGCGDVRLPARPGIDAGPSIDAGPPPDASLACVEEDLGSQVGSPVYSGDTTGELDQSESCEGEPGFGDVALLWTAPTTGQYQFDTCGSTFDTLLTARTADCGGMELKCNDDSVECGGDESVQSRFTLDLVEGERILLVVDGFDAEGQFQLNIEAL
jgi:hypothetical protein